MEEVIVATKNPGKAKEFERIFGSRGFKVKTLLDYPEIDDIEETGHTFEENAVIKAETVSKQLNKMVISDDSGLMVDALNGRPGIFSARYAGQEKNDEANIEKVLEELKGVPTEKRTGRFYCALAVASPFQETFTVSGTCEGRILNEKKGTNGFGYDPIFFVEPLGLAMAELTSEEKNSVSHRANAIRNLESLLDTFLGRKENKWLKS